jgi:hypothetical protein
MLEDAQPGDPRDSTANESLHENTQLPSAFETQHPIQSTQATTQVDETELRDFDSSMLDKPTQIQEPSYQEQVPDARDQLSVITARISTPEEASPHRPNDPSATIRKVTVLKYTSKDVRFSAFDHSSDQGIVSRSKTGQTQPEQGQTIPVRTPTSVEKPAEWISQSTSQSQTTRFLRSALRKQGHISVPPDTFQELVTDGVARTQPRYGWPDLDMVPAPSKGAIASTQAAVPGKKTKEVLANTKSSQINQAVNVEIAVPKRVERSPKRLASARKPKTATKASNSNTKGASKPKENKSRKRK